MTPIARRLRSAASRDEGLSMAELLVYSVLLGGVLLLVGSLLINSLRTERTVTTVVDATTAAQLATRSIDGAIRNSSGFVLTPVAPSDQVLLARVSNEDGVYRCVAWYYSDSEGTIRTTSSATKILPVSWSTADKRKSWTLLAEGVQPAAGKASTDPILAVSGVTSSMVKLDFRVLAGDNPPATISSSVAVRLTEASTQCW